MGCDDGGDGCEGRKAEGVEAIFEAVFETRADDAGGGSDDGVLGDCDSDLVAVGLEDETERLGRRELRAGRFH